MKGGLTISGGEPLMQHKFVIQVFSAAKAMGVHTALDTNGYYGDLLSDDELASIDLVLLDIKAWDPARHMRYVGMEIEPDAGLRAAARGARVARSGFGMSSSPGGPTTRRHRAGSRSSRPSLGTVERVDVLPFHQMGRYKWSNLNLTYGSRTSSRRRTRSCSARSTPSRPPDCARTDDALEAGAPRSR